MFMFGFIFWMQFGIISLQIFFMPEFSYLWQFTFPCIAFIHPVLGTENGKMKDTVSALTVVHAYRWFDRNEYKFSKNPEQNIV